MWDVDNQTGYAHAHSWDRDRTGAETWIVVVKGTFDIGADGATRIADEQPPVCELPQYRGGPGDSSLRLDTDLLRVKPTTDIIVGGHAHAPRGRAVSQLDVTLKLDAFEKTLRVFGDRPWLRGMSGPRLGAPQPFQTMPLLYERAFGGADRSAADPAEHRWDERNPVGVGFAVDPVQRLQQIAPNIVYPGGSASDWSERQRPAGFGPIPPHWLPRRQWGGTYDAGWRKRRMPLVPDDLDDRFYQCAPPDQWPPAHLTGGETVELRHMTDDGLLQFRLPKVTLGFETAFYTGERVLHRQVLHSVVIEPDARRVSMVWQTTLMCHTQVLNLDHTEVLEKVRVSVRAA